MFGVTIKLPAIDGDMENKTEFAYAVPNHAVIYTTYTMFGILPWSYVNVTSKALLEGLEGAKEPHINGNDQ